MYPSLGTASIFTKALIEHLKLKALFCSDDTQCKRGLSCVDGKCQKRTCSSDEQCKNLERCQMGQCVKEIPCR